MRKLGLVLLGAVLLMGMTVLQPLAAVGQESRSGAPEKPALREQTVYIPYEKLRDVFEQRGRGVFLPYEEFMTLWNAARAGVAAPESAGPPVKSMITESDSTATVSRDVMTVQAEIKIEVLAEGWHEIPLGLVGAAITRATLEGKPARLLFDAETGYRLLVEKTGAEPQVFALGLEYAREISRTAGMNSVSFQSPSAPVSRWNVSIPETSAKVNISPAIASTEVPPAAAEAAPAADGPRGTKMLAFVGAAPRVTIQWTPKAEGAKDLDAMASVQVYQQLLIDEGVIRTRAQLVYSISRAEVGGLIIEVPADEKVVSVVDANVQRWSVESSGGVQKIIVELFQPARDRQAIDVELERFTSDAATAEVVAPVIRAVGADRQQGFVVVKLGSGLRSEAMRRQGLLQVDATELPRELRGTWQYGYRYSALPYDLMVRVEKIQPRVLVDSIVAARLQPDEMRVDLLAVFTVEQAGIFKLEFDVPAGLELQQVTGVALQDGVEAAQVAGHTLEGADGRRLVVNLSKRILGKAALVVQWRRAINEPLLQEAVGRTVEISVPLPRVAAGTVERDTAAVVVYVPESLKVSAGKVSGLRRLSAAQVFKQVSGQVDWMSVTPTSAPALVFAAAESSVELSVLAERQKPYVAVQQFLLARVESGAVSYEARLTYDIRYNSVKTLRVDVPAALDRDIRMTTEGVTERTLTEAEGLAEGYVARVYTRDREFAGQEQLTLKWERALANLDVGQDVDFGVPVLRPMDVDHAVGQVVLVKSEQIDLRPADLKNLRMIDPRHDLMGGRTVAEAARAFEFIEKDWQLVLRATRYEPAEIKGTSIELAVVRLVVTRSGSISAQALYRMRSARQRLMIQLPEGVKFETLPMINGQQVKLERGDASGNRVLIPLVNQAPDAAFLLDLRYTVDGGGSILQVPHFPEEPAIQKVYLLAYLPEEEALLGSMGPWSADVEVSHAVYGGGAGAGVRVDHLLARLSQDLPAAASSVATFQTDGRLYAFSALQPAATPDSALRLTTLHHSWINAIVVAVILISGIILLRVPVTTKVMAVGVFVIVMVLLAVFLPTLARQITNGAMAAAFVGVLVIWTVHAVVVELPRWSRQRDAERAARLAAVSSGGVAMAAAPLGPPAFDVGVESSGSSTDEPLPPAGEGSPGGDGPRDDDKRKGGESNV